jgi:nitrogenase subunit NifH
MELGGPEVGRGCGGRGIIHGFELLEKLGFHEWGFDYVLLDFLATWSAAASACRSPATCARR